MADDTEIERMLEENMQEHDRIDKPRNGEKEKEKEKKHKKHKHHKHHKSHKSERKHDRKRSRSPVKERSRPRSPSPSILSSGKRRDVTSELHQLAQTLNRGRQSDDRSSSKTNRREKTPELTPEERDLRTVFCKYSKSRSFH